MGSAATMHGAEERADGCEALRASGASRRCSEALDSPPTLCGVSAEQSVGDLHGLVRLLLRQQALPLAQVHRLQCLRWRRDQRGVESGMAPGSHCVESQHGSRREVVLPEAGCLDVRKVEEVQASIGLVAQPVQQVVGEVVVEHYRTLRVDHNWGWRYDWAEAAELAALDEAEAAAVVPELAEA